MNSPWVVLAEREAPNSLPVAPVVTRIPASRNLASAPTPIARVRSVASTPTGASSSVAKIVQFASTPQMPHTASAPVLPNAWVTPTTVEMGSDSIIRARSKVNKENKENHQGAAPPTPDKAGDKTRKALAELLTPTTQTHTVSRVGRVLTSSASTTSLPDMLNSRERRPQSAAADAHKRGSSIKPRTLTRLELGTTPFGMPRCETPLLPTPPLAPAAPKLSELSAATGDYVSVWQHQVQRCPSCRPPPPRWATKCQSSSGLPSSCLSSAAECLPHHVSQAPLSAFLIRCSRRSRQIRSVGGDAWVTTWHVSMRSRTASRAWSPTIGARREIGSRCAPLSGLACSRRAA